MQEITTWGLATVLGPIVLLALFIFVIMRNRKSSISRDVTEDATRENYAAEDRAEKNDEI